MLDIDMARATHQRGDAMAVQHRPNDVFRAARLRMPSPYGVGPMSREELADAANLHLSSEDRDGPITADLIGRIEQGRTAWPRAHRRAAFRAVFGVDSDTQLGFFNRRRRRSTELCIFPGQAAQLATRPGSAVDDVRGSTATFSPRATTVPEARSLSYVPFLPSALDRPALDWLLDGRMTNPSAIGEARWIEPSDVHAASVSLAALRSRDHQLGAGVLYPQVDAFLKTDVRRLLSGRPADAETARQVNFVAVGAYELAGYQAVDLGADGAAQRHYLHALALAQGSGDRPLGAYLLAVSIGHLALHCGHPRRGLQMANAAILGAPGMTPLVNTAVHAVLARAYARLGDEPACADALSTAEAGLQRCDLADEPDWVRYLTPAYLADEIAHCLFDLDRHESAQHEVIRAVAGVSRNHVRRLAIDTSLLASSMARSGMIDGACIHGRQAVDLAIRTTSVRTVQRIAQLRLDLSPYGQQLDVVEFLDYQHTLLPAAG
jgi:hypothetical protein